MDINNKYITRKILGSNLFGMISDSRGKNILADRHI